MYLPGGQELSRVDATGVVAATRYYVFNGKTVAVRTGTGYAGVTSLVSDPHATAEVAIDNGTNAITRRYLDPYGNEQGSTGTWVGDHGFLNKPVDGTGLVAIGARYYDPSVGRFISVDPVMVLTDPQQWAAYAYASNNPAFYWDPTGLWPDWLDDAASSAWNATSDAVVSAWDATAEWAHDHPEIVQGLGVVAAGVCIAASGGACLVLTVASVVASTASNYSELQSGSISTGQFFGRLAVDVGFAALPAVRSARAATHTEGMLNGGLRGALTASSRGQHAVASVSSQLRNAFSPRLLAAAWRQNPLRSALYMTSQVGSGVRSATNYNPPFLSARQRGGGGGASARMQAY